MICVKLQGGLGNQMFQYALGKTLSVAIGTELILDTSSFEKNDPAIVHRTFDLPAFSISARIATKQEISLCKSWNKNTHHLLNRLGFIKGQYVSEKQYRFDPKILFSKEDSMYLDGYWQSWKYFDRIDNIIRSEFKVKTPMPPATKRMLDKIVSSESVCINVRRTDFVNHGRNSKFHGFCDIDYFDAATKEIERKIHSPSYFVFSDDIEWCRKNIAPRYKATLVEQETAGDHFEWYLYLISQCRHQIIPNSSFGWWGAWLNKNPEKIVIAPKKWTNTLLKTTDLIPKSWLQI